MWENPYFVIEQVILTVSWLAVTGRFMKAFCIAKCCLAGYYICRNFAVWNNFVCHVRKTSVNGVLMLALNLSNPRVISVNCE